MTVKFDIRRVKQNSIPAQKSIYTLVSSLGVTVVFLLVLTIEASALEVTTDSFPWEDVVIARGNISVIGAGMDKTIINIGRDGYFVFYHNGRNSEPVRISGMTFNNCKNALKLRDATHWRVDHIKSTKVNRAIMSSRSVPGLIDNCEFIDGSLVDSGISHTWSKKNTGVGYDGECLPWPDRNFGTTDAIFPMGSRSRVGKSSR